MAQLLAIPPQTRVLISVSFEAFNENTVGIFEQSTGQMLKGFNNYFGGGGVWDSGPNTGSFTRLIRVEGSHKNTPPDGSEPWHPSAERDLFNSPMNRIIGYEDSNDGDFNDATANVLWQRVPGTDSMGLAIKEHSLPETDPNDPSPFSSLTR